MTESDWAKYMKARDSDHLGTRYFPPLPGGRESNIKSRGRDQEDRVPARSPVPNLSGTQTASQQLTGRPRSEQPELSGQLTASATIARGVTTNRVRVKKRVARRTVSAGTAKARFRKDPLTRGLDYVCICISLPVAELEQLDSWSERVQMARSHFLRQAAKHFAAKIGIDK